MITLILLQRAFCATALPGICAVSTNARAGSSFKKDRVSGPGVPPEAHDGGPHGGRLAGRSSWADEEFPPSRSRYGRRSLPVPVLREPPPPWDPSMGGSVINDALDRTPFRVWSTYRLFHMT